MDDRELLELAAKAVGLELGPVGYEVGPASFDGDGLCKYHSGGFVTWQWRPLTDDGDAFRLAVKLGIEYKIKNKATWFHLEHKSGNYLGYESHGNDPYAATRRAIVRAAAEIGKGMQ